jgi:outer membrane protein W
MKKVMLIAALLVLICPTFLSALNYKETEKAQKAEVIADEAEIFLEANQHSIVIDTIPRGTTVTLFPSGKKNKKWLYISYLSQKRGSKVTGFVDSHRVEIIKQNPPVEPEDTAEPPSEEENSDPAVKETRDVEKELEELRNLLKEMEKEKQGSQAQLEKAQDIEDKNAAEEQEVVNEVAEAQKEENPEITETVEPHEAAKEENTEESEDKIQEPKEKGEETHALEQEEAQADETATIEEVQETEAVESESQDAAKEEKADEKEDSAQKQEETKTEGQVLPAQDETLAEEEATVELEPEAEVEELSKVLTKVSVKVPRANIRLMPTTQSPVINQVRSGVELKHMAKTGNWHRVNLAPNKDGIVLSGYIHQNIVDEIYETVAPPPEPEKPPEIEPEVPKEEAESDPEPVQEISTFQTSRFGEYYWVGGGAGYTMPSESQFKKGINFGGTFGFGVMKHLAIELRVPYFQSDVIGTADGLSSGQLSSLSLMLSVQGRYPIKNQFVPYLVAGGDYHLNTFSLNEKITNSWNDLGFNIQESVDHSFGFHFGAGLDVFLVKNIALNLDARYYTANLTGKRTLAHKISQDTMSGAIGNMKLNSLQAGISVKLFLDPLKRKR